MRLRRETGYVKRGRSGKDQSESDPLSGPARVRGWRKVSDRWPEVVQRREAARTCTVVLNDVSKVHTSDSPTGLSSILLLDPLEQRDLLLDRASELLVLGRVGQEVQGRLLVLVDGGGVGPRLEQRSHWREEEMKLKGSVRALPNRGREQLGSPHVPR